MEFPTYEQMAKDVAEKALDEILYDGKSIREWMKIIIEQEQNTGHWIERELVGDVFKFKDSRKILICSNCKMGIAKEILGMSNFCPNCGCRMKSEVSE